MDKNQVVNEIVEEVEGFGDSTKKKELIELFVTVMLIKTDATELAGVADRQYVAYLKLFDQDASMNDIKLCLSDVLKIEPLLKKI